MHGMNRITGKAIEDRDHLVQSIEMILNTPIGSRVMRPGFGSKLPSLVAAPMSPATDLRIYAATIDALNRWEPRLLAERVDIVSRESDGTLTLRLTGEYFGEQVALNGIRISGFTST